MRKSLLAPVAIVVLAASPMLRAADTAPAPVSTKDFSSPIAAIKSFLQASYNQLDLSQPQDDAAITNTMIIPDAQKNDVNAYLSLTSASAKLERASADIFGAAATSTALHDGGRDVLAARLKYMDSASVTVTGDTATIQIPEDKTNRIAAGSVVLHRVNGQWKIDAASLFSINNRTPKEISTQTDLLKKVSAITEQVTTDVRAKKFTSARDVYAELQTRVAKVLSTASPSASPAAQP